MSPQKALNSLIKVLFCHPHCALSLVAEGYLRNGFRVQKEHAFSIQQNEELYTLRVMDTKDDEVAVFRNFTLDAVAEYIITEMHGYSDLVCLDVFIDERYQGAFTIDLQCNYRSGDESIQQLRHHTDNDFCNRMYDRVEDMTQGII